ncbi:MAG: metal ABC transporter ATP-binding protein [Clostridia bacterium]|nr:metal ABC transporter ATP-binding protein [Clostridia bacterium]
MIEKCGYCCTKIRNINVSFGKKEVLKNVNIHIHCGKLTAIIGKNGAGKSTLLKAILGEVKHTGTILFKDRENSGKKIKIGYVPQKLDIENSPATVYDVVVSFTSKYPSFLPKSKKYYEEIKEHLKEFGAESLIDSKINTLSGGQLQRVMLAIATMPYPDLLILDEPVSGIDRNGKEMFYEKIHYLKENYDLAVLMVSHDFEYVKRYADKVILLDKTIVAKGKADDVMHSKEFVETFGKVEG